MRIFCNLVASVCQVESDTKKSDQIVSVASPEWFITIVSHADPDLTSDAINFFFTVYFIFIYIF